MKTLKEVERTIEEVDMITCDCCGYEQKEGPQHWITCDRDMISTHHMFGYGSSNDQSTLDFDICEECLFDMLKKSNVNYRLLERL